MVSPHRIFFLKYVIWYNFWTGFFLGWQAKSPIRTLDELTITEVASSTYFPSMLEREQSNIASASSLSISMKFQNESPSLAGISDELIENSGAVAVQGFGERKRHRCFLVTARAQSFLYHQVASVLLSQFSMFLYIYCISAFKKHKDSSTVLFLSNWRNSYIRTCFRSE